MRRPSSSRFLLANVLFLGLLPGCFRDLPADGAGDEPGPASDGARCSTPEDPDRLADQVLQLVNLERAENDLPPLARNSVLDKLAADYACRMIVVDFFGHTDPETGDGPGDRALAAEYSYYAIGENLAAGQESAGDVMKVWMESPSHRGIILDEKWTEIGISVRVGGEYSIYWVQEFGAPSDR